MAVGCDHKHINTTDSIYMFMVVITPVLFDLTNGEKISTASAVLKPNYLVRICLEHLIFATQEFSALTYVPLLEPWFDSRAQLPARAETHKTFKTTREFETISLKQRNTRRPELQNGHQIYHCL